VNNASLRAISLLCALAACGSQNATTNITSESWRADLRDLARDLPRRHTNAFHTVSRQTFAAEVAQLDSAIPRLDDDQILVRLMRLVALVGDGHTHLDQPPSWPRYPVELAWFGHDLRVVAVADPYRVAAGGRVLGIGNVPLDSIMGLTSRLVPTGENAGRTRVTATILLASPAILHGLGVTESRDDAPFVIQTARGERVTVTLHPIFAREMSGIRLATEKPALWVQRLSEAWWTEALPDSHTVYLSLSRYPAEAEFRKHADALARLLEDSGAERLVIDLRRNGGGDFQLFRSLLLPVIRGHPALRHAGSVYAITGPITFSAAMVNALDLRREVNAVLVGEPTGARPNSYSEHGEFRLPNSGLGVSYSTRHYRFAADSDTAVVPDVQIEPTWEQFRSGRDPVLDWILAQAIR
jgi:hypothetical protein